MRLQRCVRLIVAVMLALVGTVAHTQNAPEGQLTIAFDTTIAPSYLDPAEVAGLATPFTFSMRCTTPCSNPYRGIIWRRAWRSPGRRVLMG